MADAYCLAMPCPRRCVNKRRIASCCRRDEGGPLESALEAEVSNSHKSLRSRYSDGYLKSSGWDLSAFSGQPSTRPKGASKEDETVGRWWRSWHSGRRPGAASYGRCLFGPSCPSVPSAWSSPSVEQHAMAKRKQQSTFERLTSAELNRKQSKELIRKIEGPRIGDHLWERGGHRKPHAEPRGTDV